MQNAECHNAKCRFAECRYAECRGAHKTMQARLIHKVVIKRQDTLAFCKS